MATVTGGAGSAGVSLGRWGAWEGGRGVSGESRAKGWVRSGRKVLGKKQSRKSRRKAMVERWEDG
jgi:hypothetical protein